MRQVMLLFWYVRSFHKNDNYRKGQIPGTEIGSIVKEHANFSIISGKNEANKCHIILSNAIHRKQIIVSFAIYLVGEFTGMSQSVKGR